MGYSHGRKWSDEIIEKARKIDVVKKHMEYCNNAKCSLKKDCVECTICFMLQNYNVTE